MGNLGGQLFQVNLSLSRFKDPYVTTITSYHNRSSHRGSIKRQYHNKSSPYHNKPGQAVGE